MTFNFAQWALKHEDKDEIPIKQAGLMADLDRLGVLANKLETASEISDAVTAGAYIDAQLANRIPPNIVNYRAMTKAEKAHSSGTFDSGCFGMPYTESCSIELFATSLKIDGVQTNQYIIDLFDYVGMTSYYNPVFHIAKLTAGTDLISYKSTNSDGDNVYVANYFDNFDLIGKITYAQFIYPLNKNAILFDNRELEAGKWSFVLTHSESYDWGFYLDNSIKLVPGEACLIAKPYIGIGHIDFDKKTLFKGIPMQNARI